MHQVLIHIDLFKKSYVNICVYHFCLFIYLIRYGCFVVSLNKWLIDYCKGKCPSHNKIQ